VSFQFGDTIRVPDVPTLVKARPLVPDNENAILFNLNRVRHFVFVRDAMPFSSKRDELVWRGTANKPLRRRFLKSCFGLRRLDVGDTGSKPVDPAWRRPYMSIAGQLEFKYVLSLEGNDIASNLKWILSSNSVCFMPRPRVESWFMEGQLIADHHYVCIRDDFSDIEEKISYYTAHPDEAQRIVRNANAHAARFMDPESEDLVALTLLRKYFEESGQLPMHRTRAAAAAVDLVSLGQGPN
jgi:hypothetical protein